jgi:hypothetical protein
MHSKHLLRVVPGLRSIFCGQNPGQVPPQAVERIAKEVRHEIIMLPYYGVFDDIKFSVFREAA